MMQAILEYFIVEEQILVELNDGRRVFVEGRIVESGDFVSVNGVKYKVK